MADEEETKRVQNIEHKAIRWEHRCVYETWPGRCLEARIGWKMKGNSGGPATFLFRVNPLRKFG